MPLPGQGSRLKWFHFTADDEAYIGISDKDLEDMSLDDYVAGLERVPDRDIYPELPADQPVTVAPENLDKAVTFVKHGGITMYSPDADARDVKDQLRHLEKLSKRPNPYIV